MDTTKKIEQEASTGEDAGQVLCFILDDPLLAAKQLRREEFSRQVKLGLAKASDASIFSRFGVKWKVRYRSDEF